MLGYSICANQKHFISNAIANAINSQHKSQKTNKRRPASQSKATFWCCTKMLRNGCDVPLIRPEIEAKKHDLCLGSIFCPLRARMHVREKICRSRYGFRPRINTHIRTGTYILRLTRMKAYTAYSVVEK